MWKGHGVGVTHTERPLYMLNFDSFELNLTNLALLFLVFMEVKHQVPQQERKRTKIKI